MGSTTSRGNQAQDDAKLQLEKEGWLVEMAKPSLRVRWSRKENNYVAEPKHDFFRVADLIAVKKDRVRFIQVTHPSGVGERVMKMRTTIPVALLESDFLSWEVWERTKTGFEIRLVLAEGHA